MLINLINKKLGRPELLISVRDLWRYAPQVYELAAGGGGDNHVNVCKNAVTSSWNFHMAMKYKLD